MEIYGNKLLNTIETKPLCVSLSNLAEMLTMVNPIDFAGHSSKVQVYDGYPVGQFSVCFIPNII